MPQISPHAIVACPANLADDVVVGAFSYIGPDVRIGSGTRVDTNVTLDGRVTIGAGCHIYPYAVVGQASANGDPAGSVRLGNRTNIREHSVICVGSDPDGPGTQIGDDNLLMTGCYVGPDVVIDDHVVLGNYSQLAERTHVEPHVWAAAFTGTDADVTIGQYSFTSGYAGIDRDAPPFAMLQGYPFRVRGVNSLNLRRCGFTDRQISGLKDLFRALFDENDRPVEAVMEDMAAREDLDELQRYLLDFVRLHSCTRSSDSPGKEGA